MVFKRIAAVLLWLLVSLTSAFGFMASELKTAPDDFFCGTLEDAGENGPSTREQCRINGWLNYDTASGCTVAARNPTPHKNSLDYVGETHVYRVRGPDGTYKIGESAQGVRVGDGASIRAEQQARRLTRETGDRFETDIRRTFPDKRSAREYETRLIERFRRMFGDDTLPGNKTNR